MNIARKKITDTKLREKYGLTPQAIAERIIAKLESLR